jgi:DNA topoisomerase IA
MEIVILVESFSKIKTIQKLLDNTVSVEATGGHICNLPSKQLGIDVDNNFILSFSSVSWNALILFINSSFFFSKIKKQSQV